MKALFSHDFATEDEMVLQHVDIIGPLPSPWRERWSERGAEFFDEQGRRRNPGEMLWPSLEVAFEDGVQKWRRKLGAGVFSEEEKEAFLSLIRRMLVFRPEERISAEEVLKSEWMVKWVMPDIKYSLREDGNKEAGN
jgi:serine/threonine protein kinase